MKVTFLFLALLSLGLLVGCASNGPRAYQPPKSGPMATVNLFAPTIQSSSANSEVDFEIFAVQPDCSLNSLGWITLTPTNFNKPIKVVADEVLFIRLDYFQTDIVLARNNRGEVKFALKPSASNSYTIEYKGTGSRFDMNVWEGNPADNVQGKLLDPLEWNERNGKVVYRGQLNCNR